ncbi:hypothetical protein ABZZ36_43240 [Actinacidiphila glaucinigra]|uniref:hypothetical protein n=1 Tax=Actinacidiphila glaucinigra TaxID=235986 RepID=UPI0033B4FE4C
MNIDPAQGPHTEAAAELSSQDTPSGPNPVSDDEIVSACLEHTRHLADQVIHGDDPHETASYIMGALLDVFATYDHAGGVYVVWGALTDWIELKPQEEALAKRHMVAAAREWLALDPHDDDAVRRYLTHWHDIVGYDGS